MLKYFCLSIIAVKLFKVLTLLANKTYSNYLDGKPCVFFYFITRVLTFNIFLSAKKAKKTLGLDDILCFWDWKSDSV